MPGFDRTGPMGTGPMTGGARGRCNSRRACVLPAYTGAGRGGEFGFGRGFRGGDRGWIGRGHAYVSAGNRRSRFTTMAYEVEPAEELEYLKQQAREMSASLKAINQRIDKLSQQPPESQELPETT